MNERWFKLPNNRGVIRFNTESLQHMYSHAQTRWNKPEAGGQLFSKAPESSEVLICCVTGPHPTDRRSRCGFCPDVKMANTDRQNLFSLGYYAVGLWHTHPEHTPAPSIKDIRTTHEYLQAFNGEMEGFLLITIGNKGTPLNMSVCLATLTPQKSWVELNEIPPESN